MQAERTIERKYAVKIPDRGQYVCPGSVYVPTSEGRCLCGQGHAHHMYDSRGRVPEDIRCENPNCRGCNPDA